MADVDPDEELARQLHREMNGLTRVRRRAAPPHPPRPLLLVWSPSERKEGCQHRPDRFQLYTLGLVSSAIHCCDRKGIGNCCKLAGGRLESLKDSRPSSAQPSGEGAHRRGGSKSNDGDQSSRDLQLKSGPQGFKRLRRHGGARATCSASTTVLALALSVSSTSYAES